MKKLLSYRRRPASVVRIGTICMGGDNPIRIQSMTTTNTNDTEASVAQSERIIDAGGELVRLTTQGTREAENLKNISALLRSHGYTAPLVADVHFNANVADVAACYAEKVRINPGNYVDPARTFKRIEYTDEEYAAELRKIEERLLPFIQLCKEHHTAVRLGVNHGSLSDRIRNRYGDTPEGIVESCLEFLRIFRREQFNDVVISIKSSNTVVMVNSVRLLVEAMDREDMHYPLHLGVTEAGEGENGRIKSAVGIGTLLTDGIGDTIRVSLSEEPEAEIPVARHLVDYITHRPADVLPMEAVDIVARTERILPYPVVLGADDVSKWVDDSVEITLQDINASLIDRLYSHPHLLVVVNAATPYQHRWAISRLHEAKVSNPIVVSYTYHHSLQTKEALQIEAAADFGPLLIDRLADGIRLLNNGDIPQEELHQTAFAILQAARLRQTKPEYISCPGCGRTLYHLPETIRRIKEATAHLVGLKIGIMGCIVNGPGEMADADYGYVGAGPGRISLYRRQECVEKNIPENEAVEHLLRVIESDQKND